MQWCLDQILCKSLIIDLPFANVTSLEFWNSDQNWKLCNPMKKYILGVFALCSYIACKEVWIRYSVWCLLQILCKSNALDILKIWPALEDVQRDPRIYPNIFGVILPPAAIPHAIIFTSDISYDVYYESDFYKWNSFEILKILQELKAV